MAISTAETRAADAIPEPRRRHANTWVWQVTGLSLVLGIMLALALQTEFRLRERVGRFGVRARIAAGLKDQNERLQEEVSDLRARSSQIEKDLSQRTGATAALADELREAKLDACLLPVEGPGLVITLRDTPLKIPDELSQQGIVHDSDVNLILSELKTAGAEALGIAGADTDRIQRVTYRTSVRCIGPGMDVNDTRLGGPYRIYAIGNPKELRAQLEMRDGVVDKLELDKLQMIQIKEEPKVHIPAYSGSFSFKYAKPSDPGR
jgi:uncharacterized protein YlxW (UPF0749 family)